MKRTRNIFLLFSLLVLFAGFDTRAASLDDFPSLGDLEDETETLTIGDIEFYDWQFEGSVFLPFPDIVDMADIKVKPIIDEPLHPGLEFIIGNVLTFSGTIAFAGSIGYNVKINNEKDKIWKNSLKLSGVVTDPERDIGTIIIDERVTNNAGDNNSDALTKQVYFNLASDEGGRSTKTEDRVQFNPTDSFSVVTNITLNQDNFSYEGQFGVTSFEQGFTLVPIPGTVWLLSSVLTCLVGAQKRRRS
jgi:hypothetical protein